MRSDPPADLVVLARACRAATDAEALLADSLETLRTLAGARSAVVLRQRDGIVAAVAAAGDTVDERDLPALHDSAEALPLPGHAGVLVVVGAESPDEAYAAALDIVTAALARLDAEERYSDLVQRVDNAQQLANMGDYDWHIASDTNRWSDQLYRIYGHEPQSFNASYERFLSFIHPDDRERIQGIHQQAYATGEPYQMIERIVRPDGEVRYLSSNGQVVMDAQGQPMRMRGTCIDITDQVRAEQERERSSDRFRSLVESSPDAILLLDESGSVLACNGRAHQLLGGDPVGQLVVEFLPVHGATPGRGVDGIGFDGRSLTLDVEVAALNRERDPGLLAVYLRDARPRMAHEAVVASLREVEVRRHQAIEINDNLVQGLTAAVYALEHGNRDASVGYLHKTLAAARRMMNDLIGSGGGLAPGDLVREVAATLPTDDSEVRMANGASTAHPGPGRRVLIADDSDDVRLLVRMKLEMHGVADVVGEAENGLVAVEMATILQPDLVLLDLAMPRMDGLEALPLIRGAAPQTRVVVLSGFDENTMASKALAAGAVRYVEKGVALADLAKLLDEVFDSPEPVGT